MTLRLRTEEPGDTGAVRALVVAAFADGTGQAQAQLLDVLRGDPSAWLPRFSIVAVDDEGLVGHVLCTRAHVSMASLMAPALVLQPVSVAPHRQRQGIGTALVERVVAEARTAGETLVVAVGDPGFFARVRFRPAEDLGLIGPGAGPSFLGLALAPDHPVGDVAYPFAFTAR